MNTESDAQKVALQFDKLTLQVAQGFKRQLELARAAGDEPEVVKQQIKLEVLKAARGMFAGSYRVATGKKPEGDWNNV
jgi:hypothetical protein